MTLRSTLLLSALLLLFFPFSCPQNSAFEPPQKMPTSGKDDILTWRRVVAEAPLAADLPVANGSFLLAAERTYRRDPLNGYKKYTGGWNISNMHYLASVGFTAAPLFAIALLWFIFFGLVLISICFCYCCCLSRSYSYSRTSYALSLILLIVFTCAAIIGCIVLYDGQGRFYGSTTSTLNYVVGQANLTVDNLRNFSDSLAAAKKVGVEQMFLHADVQGQIDAMETKLNSSTTELARRTFDNSKKIQNALNTMRMCLIILAAVMLLLTFLGFLFSIFGLQFLVSFLVLVGWILVTGTFILCGIFVLLHNVVEDTCVAMDEWVGHPHAHTALDDILPCVDVATANESLYSSREVTSRLVNLVNQAIEGVSHRNFPFSSAPLYYNQSGPLMPMLCNPYMPDMSNRTCLSGEVDLFNASQVWWGYVCQSAIVSGSEICTSMGQVTLTIYNQMTAAVNVSRALHRYGPFLIQLEDCTFVRKTFALIGSNNCPGLERHSCWIYIGLAMVSAAVMLSLIFWVIYARERRHRKYNKQLVARLSSNFHLSSKTP